VAYNDGFTTFSQNILNINDTFYAETKTKNKNKKEENYKRNSLKQWKQ